ncbi:MAG: hypothetical protein CMP33_06090 [Rickettsiales bacterium]|nr:hypothetical protein [Rickettsiales bacterium]
MVKMISKKKIFFQKDNSFLKITGDDHLSFLQGLITNDIYSLSQKKCIYTGFLTPQGKFLFDFFIFRIKEGVFLECRKQDRDNLLNKLLLYRLKSKVTIAKEVNINSYLICKDDVKDIQSSGNGLNIRIFNDPRSEIFSWKMLCSSNDFCFVKNSVNLKPINNKQYNSIRLESSIPQSSEDLIPNKSFLLEVRFDQLNGISWEKGCYIGQELTARTKYRSNLKKKIFGIRIINNKIKDKEIFFENKIVGTINSFDSHFGIATINIEEAEKCISKNSFMSIGDCKVKPFIPKWVKKVSP